MKSIIKFLFALTFFSQVNFAQTFDAKLISKDLEINLTAAQRGIEKDSIIYLVEKDFQTISAYKDNTLLWQTNVISVCGKPKVGEPKIRYLKHENTKLLVVFGKHDYAEVDIKNGKTVFLGSD